MKVVHLMTGGGVGGIQTLLRQYANYSKENNVFVFAYGEGPCCDEMEKNGIHIYRMVEKRGIDKFKSIVKIISAEKPDIIVEHFCAPYLRLVMLYYKFFLDKSVKTVVYQHHDAALDGDNATGVKKKILRKIDETACHKVDSIIAISNFVKESLLENYGLSENKIKVIYNGVELKKFTAEEHKNNELIYVGRLVEGKGVQLILNALKNVKHEYHFNIIGDGPYRKALEELVQKNEIDRNVTFWGAQKEPENFINQSAIFIHMPIFEEGFGITVVEAMAAGLTVITTQSGGIPEIIRNNENGYLVERNNENELGNVIESVLNEYNSSKNVTMREQAVVDAKQYAIEAFSEKLDESWK